MYRQVMMFIIFFSHSAWTQSLNVCVFDGGGSNPLCGREVYNEGVDSVYQGKSVARIDFLSGDGNDEKNDCGPKYYGEEKCSDPKKSHFAQIDIPTSSVTGYNTPVITSRSYATVTNVKAGSSKNFVDGCFPPKVSQSTSADPKSVCHFWSANHGMQGGITTYHSSALITPSTVGRKFANSNCGTTRMVLNNCYSGQFMALSTDVEGNAIPGICGVSATSRSEVAVGSGAELERRQDSQGEEFVVAGINYDFTREFNQALVDLKANGKVPTMDEAFAIAQMNDPMNEFPTSSSSFFIKQYRNREGFNNVESESVLIDCLGSKLGLDIFSSQLSELSLAIKKVATTLPQNGIDSVSVPMQALAQKDIENQKRRLIEFEKKLCRDYYKGECDPAKASAFIQAKYQQGTLNGQAAVAQELATLRTEYAKKSAAQSALIADYSKKTDAQVSAEMKVTKQLDDAKSALRLNFTEAPEKRLKRMETSLAEAQAQLAVAKGKEAKTVAQAAIDKAAGELETERARQAPLAAEIVRLEEEKKRLELERKTLEASNPYHSPLDAELKALDTRIKSISSSALLDIDKMAPKAGFAAEVDDCGISDGGSDKKEEFSTFMNRYAEMRENFVATTQLMTSGSQKDISNYLTIKQCEMTDFYKPAF